MCGAEEEVKDERERVNEERGAGPKDGTEPVGTRCLRTSDMRKLPR
jgi:hypothetical protein